jgi:hypothetical protein
LTHPNLFQRRQVQLPPSSESCLRNMQSLRGEKLKEGNRWRWTVCMFLRGEGISWEGISWEGISWEGISIEALSQHSAKKYCIHFCAWNRAGPRAGSVPPASRRERCASA